MKKFYTLALATLVALGATAGRQQATGTRVFHKADIANQATAQTLTKQMFKKQASVNETFSATRQQATTNHVFNKAELNGVQKAQSLSGRMLKKGAPAKAPATAADVEALDIWSFYGLLQNQGAGMEYALDITIDDASTGAATITLVNQFELPATFDATAGTLTIPTMYKLGEDLDGDIIFYLKELDDDGYTIDGASNKTETVGTYADGKITFPELDVWAIGDPTNESVGWYVLSAMNEFTSEVSTPVTPGDDDEWVSLGQGKMTENLIYKLFTGENNATEMSYEIMYNGAGKYKVIDAYKATYAALGITVSSPALEIDATDPDNLKIELQSTGLQNSTDGGYYIFNEGWYCDQYGDTLDPSLICTKTVEGNTVTITIPYHSTTIFTSSTQQFYYGSAAETKIVFTTEGEEPTPGPGDDEEEWISLGNGKMTENIIYGACTGEINEQEMNYEIQTNGKGLYRVMDAYKATFAAVGVNAESEALVIDATDPTNLVIELQPTGLGTQSEGGYYVFNEVFYSDLTGTELDPAYICTKTVEDSTVTITIPYYSMTIYTGVSQEFYYAATAETKIVFTEGENQGTGVDAIEAAEGAPVYYNMQGVRVANPEGLVIRVQDGKATKMVIK